MHQVIVLARLALCAVFAFAGMQKLRDRAGFRDGLSAFGVPLTLREPVALAIIALELAVAAALLFDESAAAGAIGAAGLLAIFTTVLIAHLARGKRPACNCFGAVKTRPIGWPNVARNLVLITLAGAVAARGSQAPLLPTLVSGLATLSTQALIGALLAAIVAMLGVLCYLMVESIRQQGRILLRLDALEATAAHEGAPVLEAQPGLPIGSIAPAFSLATLDGPDASLELLEADERPVLLLFTNPHCGPCRALLSEVVRWQQNYASALTIAILSTGSAADNRKESAPGLQRVLLQGERDVAERYQVYGTPGAVFVYEGRIASHVAQGADAIRSLVAGFLDSGAQPTPPIGAAAPELTLMTDDETKIVLSQPREGDSVLLFWNSQCGFCSSLLPALRAWEAQRQEGDAELLIVTAERLDAQIGLVSTVVLDPAGRASAAFGAGGTPMAIRIDSQGRVASGLAAGGEAVLELLRRQPATPTPMATARSL
jgi:thiol-disulfide isomerase/thioredoxin/uncharacterized membrane protein YphA (DoxX/SURF4 family)